MRLLDLLLRAGLLGGCWVVLSEGRWSFWGYGAITVAVALAVSVWLAPLRRLRVRGLRRVGSALILLGWASGRVLTGAVDVARRAFGPARLVDPVELDLPVLLPASRGGALSAALSNLMPGTLVYRLEEDGDTVGMHVLSRQLDAAGGWEDLNRRVGAVYGRRP